MTKSYQSIEDVYGVLQNIPMFSDRGRSAANFSLDRMEHLCDRAGNPQHEFRTIHVAGTNGKGTTCRMLASVYQSAGYKTGLYTSPHLVDFRERITINSEWISEERILEFFRQHGTLIDELKPTYFELVTALGFWYFSRETVDVAVIETGLGGRLDATNVIHPLASVITSIGLDHTDILGDTIEEITREKAGIIKPDVPVIIGDLPDRSEQVIKQVSERNNAPLRYSEDGGSSGKLDLDQQPLAARLNSKIVKAVVWELQNILPVGESEIADGYQKWMGRFPTGASFRKIDPGYRWYFDGGHNKEALKLLKIQLQEIAPLSEWTLVFAIMRDKLNREVANELSEIGTLYYYPLKLQRAATEKEVGDLMPQVNILRADNKLPESWVQKNKSELVIFGGSFYFYKTLMQWMETIADR